MYIVPRYTKNNAKSTKNREKKQKKQKTIDLINKRLTK